MAMIFWILVALWLVAQVSGSFRVSFRRSAGPVKNKNHDVEVPKRRSRKQTGDPLRDEGQYVDFEDIT